MRFITVFAALILAVSIAAAGRIQQAQNQQQSQDQAAGKKKKKSDKNNSNANPDANAAKPAAANDKPQPLFGGSLNLKSSRQSKDTATLGFNGLDPNGQVQKAALSAPPGPGDTLKAEQVAAYHADQAELSTFLQQGNLNSQAAPKQASGTQQKQPKQ